MNKLIVNSNDLKNLFAPGCHEVLMEPLGELCIKKCASAPFCTSGWFGGAEARCPSQSVIAAGGDAFRDSSAVIVAVPNTGDFATYGPKLIVNMEDFSTDPKLMLTR